MDRFTEGIERTGADVAVNDANAAEGQGAQVMLVLATQGGRERLSFARDFCHQSSPAFSASRIAPLRRNPFHKSHPERSKNLGIYLLSPIEKTDPRGHGACQTATATRGTPRISRRLRSGPVSRPHYT